MTLKFTTTEFEHNGDTSKIQLLFEFLDDEVPEVITFHEKTRLGLNEFVGSLQTHQIQGIYLQPIVLKGTFKGTKVKVNGTKLRAKDRCDQLGRLQGRPIKFFYEGIKQIVIIEDFKYTFHNYQKVDYEMTLRPHDVQEIIEPRNSVTIFEASIDIDSLRNSSKGKNLSKGLKDGYDEATRKMKELVQKQIEGKKAENLKNAPITKKFAEQEALRLNELAKDEASILPKFFRNAINVPRRNRRIGGLGG